MRGNLWSRAPANLARPNRGFAPGRRRGPAEACRSIQFSWAGLARDAVVLAEHEGVTAEGRRPGPGCRALPGDGQGPGRRRSMKLCEGAAIPVDESTAGGPPGAAA